jgi:archaeosine synthase beta-subunit
VSKTAHRLPESDRRKLDPARAYAAVHERELTADGVLAPTVVVFLTNRQCPFECVMCDLWVNTLERSVEPGMIPRQIRHALAQLPSATQIKLYNAGSFFDPQAIPVDDDEEIAAAVGGFDRVIVEAHPAFLRGAYADRCLRFRDLLSRRRDGASPRLEVAIGLETAHHEVLAQLNKRMTVDDFRAAVAFLRAHDIDGRAFILLQPPFMQPEEALEWACRSIDVAFDAGCGVCSIIPTRGVTPPPTVEMLAAAVEYGIGLRRGRVFADLWDIDAMRAQHLRMLNETQHARH